MCGSPAIAHRDVSTNADGTLGSQTMCITRSEAGLNNYRMLEAITTFSNGVFEQPWWLNIVAPGSWHAVTVERNNTIAARLSFQQRRVGRLGWCILSNPPATQTVGPWLRECSHSYSRRLHEENELVAELLRSMPICDSADLLLSPTFTNPLPFLWNDFKVGIHCTYRLTNLGDPDRLWRGFSDKCRNAVRKAKKELSVNEGLDGTTFYDLLSNTMARQGMVYPYSRDLVCKLQSECVRRGAGKVVYVEDAHGHIHSAAFLVWDATTMYYLMAGSDPDKRGSGANNLLIWHVLQWAAEVTQTFDFEGSVIPGIEHFFRSFGATQTLMLRATKESPRFATFKAATHLAKGVFRRRQ